MAQVATRGTVPKDLQPLVDELKKEGHKLVKGGKHFKVQMKSGQFAVDANGPIIFSGSPGDFRARDMHVKRLLNAGLIKRDPWKPTEKKEHTEEEPNGFDPRAAERARVLAEQAEASRRRQERMNGLRARWEPIVVGLGGWDKRGFQSEASLVFHHVIAKEGGDLTEFGAAAVMRSVRNNETLSDHNLDLFEKFVDRIEGDDDIKVYLELLREAKLNRKKPNVMEEDEPQVEYEQLGPAYRKPRDLVMEAVALMAMGQSVDALERILDVGEKIAALTKED